MYTLAIRREFIARHFLIGGDWGAENLPNSHNYVCELQLKGPELDRHGYLVDIVEISRELDGVIGHFREQMLNELPEFKGLNPSLEHFARILALSLNERINGKHISAIRVTLWENASAWASYRVQRDGLQER